MKPSLISAKHLHIHLPPMSIAMPWPTPGSAPEPVDEPAHRFQLSNDGTTVIDHRTGLMWAAEESGARMDFASAETYCSELRLGGFDDWRLPDLPELEGIRDLTRHEPCIDTSVFKSNSTWVWSRTPTAWSSGYAWLVDFDYGHVYYLHRNYTAFVRAVRRVAPASQ
ncbi:DUF1566 domain-containing protein [Dyella lutea]|uniref:DUF1566 domain-containing protein n=1 Tax=Dyella lutea TaxID=2950441 RepID=A0ABT1FF33_9GAMM|nr:DUF1566 domain-containing protein [Dyella lutea]MCP1375994.1 DUF1566 domain-containing protein [Dyella lutea]